MITIEKAIELLADSAYRGLTTLNEDFKDAEKLAIEAMKRIDRQRKLTIPINQPPLPGEKLI